MRPIEKMRADAWAAINNYTSGPYPMSAEDVLDLLAVVEAADGLAEALTEAIEDLEPKVAAAVGTIGPASGLVRCIAWREKLSRYAAKGEVTK